MQEEVQNQIPPPPGPVPGTLQLNNVPPDAYIHGVQNDPAFILLTIKHVIADLVHDFTKLVLDQFASDPNSNPPTINALLIRLAEPYQGVNGFDINANIAALNTYYNSCTTDAAAKSKFKDALEVYLAANSKPLFYTYLKGEYPNEDKPGSALDYKALFQYIYTTYDNGGNLRWYLDAQLGNVIDKYYKWRMGQQGATGVNSYCKDLAYITDPASGLNSSNYVNVTNNATVIFDGKYTGLGSNITLAHIQNNDRATNLTYNLPNNVNRTLLIEERLNSVNETYKDLITNNYTLDIRLDKILAKSAGDRLQGYSANSVLWSPNKPIIVTNDILASFYYIFYRGCPVLVTGKDMYKFYDFGGGGITTLTNEQTTEVRNRINNNQVGALMNYSISQTADYLNTALTQLGQDNLISFYKVPLNIPTNIPIQQTDEDGNKYILSNDTQYITTPLKASKLTAGVTTAIIDLLEKVAIYERMKVKRDISSQLFPLPLPQNDPLPNLYKPLVSQTHMNTFMDLYSVYSQKVSYSQLALAFSTLETNLAKPGVIKVIYDDLVEVFRDNITMPSVPIRIIAMLITAIIYYVTQPILPTRPLSSRSGQDPAVKIRVDIRRRQRFLNELMAYEPLRAVANTVFGQKLTIDNSGNVSFNYAYNVIPNSTELGQFTPFIGSVVKSCFANTVSDVSAFNNFPFVPSIPEMNQNTGSSVYAIDVLDEAAKQYQAEQQQINAAAQAMRLVYSDRQVAQDSDRIRGKKRNDVALKRAVESVTNRNRDPKRSMKGGAFAVEPLLDISNRPVITNTGLPFLNSLDFFADEIFADMNNADTLINGFLDNNGNMPSLSEVFTAIQTTYINAAAMDTRYAWGRMGALAAVGSFATDLITLDQFLNDTYITNMVDELLYRNDELIEIARTMLRASSSSSSNVVTTTSNIQYVGSSNIPVDNGHTTVNTVGYGPTTANEPPRSSSTPTNNNNNGGLQTPPPEGKSFQMVHIVGPLSLEQRSFQQQLQKALERQEQVQKNQQQEWAPTFVGMSERRKIINQLAQEFIEQLNQEQLAQLTQTQLAALIQAQLAAQFQAQLGTLTPSEQAQLVKEILAQLPQPTQPFVPPTLGKRTRLPGGGGRKTKRKSRRRRTQRKGQRRRITALTRRAKNKDKK